MNDNNKDKEKKAGVGGLFGGGGSSAIGGGASSGFGSGGGLAGLFASKAGIMGHVLGGATLAAGVGVVYNFIGPSSKPVYNPDLFQNTYIEEEASKASMERTQSRDASAAASSTLDMFREQAKKDGLGLGAEGEGGSGEEGAKADATADSSAEAPSAPPDSAMGAGAAAGGPKLQASSGFGSKAGAGGGGSSGTSIPRMQGGAGLSGGIGGQFQPVYRPPAQANAGKTSGMTASAARVKNSPKYAVPMSKSKGAYGQAKFAGKMGAKAAYSASDAGARSGATEAFTGETSGGDVSSPNTGAGLGGAGMSNGAGLKGNDPSLSSTEVTPPKVPKPEDVDPWQKYEDMAMNSMLYAVGLILVTKILGRIAKAWPPMYYAAVAAGAAAIFFALKVVYAGFMMFSKYDQKMMGGIYILTGVMLAIQAWNAICGLGEDTKGADGKVTLSNAPDWLKGMSGMGVNLGGMF